MNLDRGFDLPDNSEFNYGKLNLQNPNSNLSEYNQHFTDKGNLHDSLGLPMDIKQLNNEPGSSKPYNEQNSLQLNMDLCCRIMTTTTTNTVVTTSTPTLVTSTTMNPTPRMQTQEFAGPGISKEQSTKTCKNLKNSKSPKLSLNKTYKVNKKAKLDHSLNAKLLNKAVINASLKAPTNETQTIVNISTSNKFLPLLDNPDMEIEIPGSEKSKSNQCNSNASTSPRKQNDKEGTDSQSQLTNKERKIKIPPITVQFSKISDDFFKFNRTVQRKLSNPIKIAYALDGVKYHTSTPADYDVLYKYFKELKLPFYTHEINKLKTIQVVLKRLPSSVTSKMLEEELNLLGYNVLHIRQMTKQQTQIDGSTTKKPLAAWVITLPHNDYSAKIYKLKDLNNHIITIEPYRNTPHLIQCHRCQSVGHTATHCHMPVQCVKCGGTHQFSDCDKKGDNYMPACANCKGQHTASYGQCTYLQHHKKLLEKRQTTKQSTQQFNRHIQESFTFTENDFPKMPIVRESFQSNAEPQVQETTTSSIGDLLKELKTLFASVNLSHITSILKTTAQKLRTAPDILTKLTALIDGASLLFDSFTANNDSH